MKIIETLKNISGFIFVILIFTAIFIAARMTSGPLEGEKTPISAFEGFEVAKETIKEDYPDALLKLVEASTAEFETRVGSWKETYKGQEALVETKVVESSYKLHDDGKAEAWQFLFYSPSQEKRIFVKVGQPKDSEILGIIDTTFDEREVLLKKWSENPIVRIDYNDNKERYIEDQLKEMKEGGLKIEDYKIDSTQVIGIVKKEVADFYLWRLKLVKSEELPLWLVYSADIKKGTSWIVGRVSAVSGEILGEIIK